jgi:protein-arginine kinase activator protein McsA
VAVCKSCGEEAEELVTVNVNGKNKRLCESCAEQLNEEEAIKEASEAVVQNMMGFKGRR